MEGRHLQEQTYRLLKASELLLERNSCLPTEYNHTDSGSVQPLQAQCAML